MVGAYFIWIRQISAYCIVFFSSGHMHNMQGTGILSNEGGAGMKDKVHTQNIFQSADAELLKKAVTAKIEKLVNSQVKKAD